MEQRKQDLINLITDSIIQTYAGELRKLPYGDRYIPDSFEIRSR
jgi:hypothetical protein